MTLFVGFVCLYLVAATVLSLRTIFHWMNRAHRAEAQLDPLRGEGPVIYGAGRR